MAEIILTKARELFFTYGLRSISMDDLAKSAGVSKKTIYQSFSDKDDLVTRIVTDLIACHTQLFTESRQKATHAIAEVWLQADAPFDTWASVNQAFFFELQKSFPTAWAKLEAHKQRFLLPGIKENLARGITEGLYRDDMQRDFTAEMRLQQLSQALQPASFIQMRLHVKQLVNEYTCFYLHGIATPKGKQILHTYLKNRNESRTKEQSI